MAISTNRTKSVAFSEIAWNAVHKKVNEGFNFNAAVNYLIEKGSAIEDFKRAKVLEMVVEASKYGITPELFREEFYNINIEKRLKKQAKPNIGMEEK